MESLLYARHSAKEILTDTRGGTVTIPISLMEWTVHGVECGRLPGVKQTTGEELDGNHDLLIPHFVEVSTSGPVVFKYF